MLGCLYNDSFYSTIHSEPIHEESSRAISCVAMCYGCWGWGGWVFTLTIETLQATDIKVIYFTHREKRGTPSLIPTLPFFLSPRPTLPLSSCSSHFPPSLRPTRHPPSPCSSTPPPHHHHQPQCDGFVLLLCSVWQGNPRLEWGKGPAPFCRPGCSITDTQRSWGLGEAAGHLVSEWALWPVWPVNSDAFLRNISVMRLHFEAFFAEITYKLTILCLY